MAKVVLFDPRSGLQMNFNLEYPSIGIERFTCDAKWNKIHLFEFDHKQLDTLWYKYKSTRKWK